MGPAGIGLSHDKLQHSSTLDGWDGMGYGMVT